MISFDMPDNKLIESRGNLLKRKNSTWIQRTFYLRRPRRSLEVWYHQGTPHVVLLSTWRGEIEKKAGAELNHNDWEESANHHLWQDLVHQTLLVLSGMTHHEILNTFLKNSTCHWKLFLTSSREYNERTRVRQDSRASLFLARSYCCLVNCLGSLACWP